MAQIVPKFLGTIEARKLSLDNKGAFEKYLQSLEGRIELTVKKQRRHRSNNQNNYYFGVVIQMLSEELGYTPEEMHEALKFHFLRDESRRLPTVKSTADLSTVEFESYLTQIRQWAAIELNISIPLPNEVEF